MGLDRISTSGVLLLVSLRVEEAEQIRGRLESAGTSWIAGPPVLAAEQSSWLGREQGLMTRIMGKNQSFSLYLATWLL